MNYDAQYKEYLTAIEGYLDGLFTGDKPYGRLYESIRYSLLAPAWAVSTGILPCPLPAPWSWYTTTR